MLIRYFEVGRSVSQRALMLFKLILFTSTMRVQYHEGLVQVFPSSSPCSSSGHMIFNPGIKFICNCVGNPGAYSLAWQDALLGMARCFALASFGKLLRSIRNGEEVKDWQMRFSFMKKVKFTHCKHGSSQVDFLKFIIVFIYVDGTPWKLRIRNIQMSARCNK